MGSSPNLSGSITMTDNASAVLTKVRGEMERTNASATKGGTAATGYGAGWAKAAIGIGVAAVGVATLKRVLVDSMQAAIQDQKSVTSLSVALKNLGLASQDANLQAWTKSVQSATGASDDLIRNGLLRMVSATKDVETAQSAVLLSMDIAAAGYTDQESAAKALSAAYLGNTTALTRLKLPLDKAILASGDMKAITAELSTLVGGQAATAAETYAGKLQRVNTAIDEASEGLGRGLLTALDAVSEAMGGPDGAVSLIDDIGVGLQRNGEGAAAFVKAMGNIGSTIPGLSGVAGALDDILKTQGGIVGFAQQGIFSLIGNDVDMVTAMLDRNSEAFARVASQTEGVTASFKDANGVDHIYIDGVEQVTTASMAAAAQQEALGIIVDDTAEALKTAAERVSGLAQAMGLLDTKAGQQQALMSWRDGLAEFVEKPSADAALGLVDDFQSAYDSFKEGGVKQAKFVIKNYADMRDAIKNSGMSEAGQRELLEPLQEARREARLLLTTLDLLDGKRVAVSVVLSQLGAAAPYVTTNSAAGGYISGPGTGTSDSIPARLSNGEYVIRAAAVRAIGVSNLNMLNAQGFAKGGPATFSNPGPTNISMAGYNYTPGRGASVGTPYSSNPDWTGGKNDIGRLPTYETGRVAQAAEAAEKAAEAAEKAARAAEEAARAEAARLAEIHRQQQIIIGQARDILADAQQTRNDYARTTASTSIGYGSISGFSSMASDWAALSMRAPGTDGAGGPASSAGSISDYMSGRLARVKSFGQVLSKLALAGLNTSTLKEVINAGPDEGLTLGQALLDAGVAEIGKVNAIQRSLEDTSGAIGAFGGNSIFGGAVVDAYGNYTSVVGSNGGVDDTPIQVNLMLDGQTVVTQLLSLKRANGGQSLGLA